MTMAINTSAVQDAARAYQSGDSARVNPAKSEYGKTVGEPKLSEAGKKYYDELKKKYGGYDFILVSKDQVENAKASAARYANPNKPVVLIDEDKIERMATDKDYRDKYEAVISGAASGLNKLKENIAATGADVKGYGIQVNDGGMTSYFAVLKKSGDAQRERIEEKRVKSREAAKAARKKADKKHHEEQLKRKRQEKAEKAREPELTKEERDKIKEQLRALADEEMENRPAKAGKDFEVVSASSIEELTQRLEEYAQNSMMLEVRTDQEKMIGQTIDFKG